MANAPPADSLAASYDAVPYRHIAHEQTHPSRLAAVARFFGLTAPPVERARVLEFGCATGGNLLPLAVGLPDAEFVGVELSARQAEQAVATARAVGLRNVTVVTGDLTTVTPDLGTFDYVICHGVYSWCPPPVRAAILDRIAAQLAPNGVAYVSYNAYPGWHFVEPLRDAAHFVARSASDPALRLARVRAFATAFRATLATRDHAVAALLAEHIKPYCEGSDAYVSHDVLEEQNWPQRFGDFAAALAARGLDYLGEAVLGDAVVTDDAGAPIERSREAWTAAQAELDQARFTHFRQSLVCRAGAAPSATVRPDAVRELCLRVGLRASREESFADLAKVPAPAPPVGPLARVALERLVRRGWSSVPFAELLDDTRASLGRAPDPAARARDEAELAGDLFRLAVLTDHVVFESVERSALRALGDAPRACPYARWLASRSTTLLTPWLETVDLPPLFAAVLPRLDGATGSAELLAWFAEQAARGKLPKDKRLPRGGKGLKRGELVSVLQTILSDLAFLGLLVA